MTGSVWSFFRDRRFTTLFGTDMWERFSFYGMQALLFLYAVAPRSSGGLGMSAGAGGALFGLYMSVVFIAALPGGWIADRLIGPRRALLCGVVVIATGHYCLALPARSTFYVGLALLAAGTGLVKPNLPVMFTELYPGASPAQRDASFAVFYLSSQVSALLAPIVTGVLGERVNWHLGFGAAAVGMTLGTAWYLAGGRHFSDEGSRPPDPVDPAVARRVLGRAALVASALALLFAIDAAAGRFRIEHALALVGLTALAAPVLYYRRLLRRPAFSPTERARLRAYRWVLVPSALFWMMFSQLGSSFALFAARNTDRRVLGHVVPASWFQSVHPLFLLVVAPLSAWLWLRLGTRAAGPAKLAGGLLSSGVGFAVMSYAAVLAAGGARVSPVWLLLAFLAQAVGEITFGPVGLSLTSEVAPPGYRGQLMGLYFLGAALGAGLGGQYARLLDVVALPVYFGAIAVAGLLGGGVLAVRSGAVARAIRTPVPVEPRSRRPQAVAATL